jgi:hypothetical protein
MKMIDVDKEIVEPEVMFELKSMLIVRVLLGGGYGGVLVLSDSVKDGGAVKRNDSEMDEEL